MKTINTNKLSLNHIKLLNEICEELKDDYHKLVESIYKETDGSIDWLVNSLLSRNNHMSNIFIDLCYIELIKKIVNTESIKLVIVKSSPQKIILTEYFKKINKNILVKCSETNYHKIKNILLPFYAFLSNIYTSFCFMSAKKPGRLDSIDNLIGIKLVDIFIINSMFKGWLFTDRYYNGLALNLPNEEKKTLYFAPTFVTKKSFKKLIEICDISKENYLYKFDLLLFRDYLFALLSPFRIKKINLNKFEFNDCNIGPILKNDFCRNITNRSSFEGILNYLFFKRMKEYGLKLLTRINSNLRFKLTHDSGQTPTSSFERLKLRASDRF